MRRGIRAAFAARGRLWATEFFVLSPEGFLNGATLNVLLHEATHRGLGAALNVGQWPAWGP